MANQVVDPLPRRAAAPQPLADGDREIGADGRMSVERDALSPASGALRLGDVVQERAQRECLRGARGKLLE